MKQAPFQDVLSAYIDPYLNTDLFSANVIESVTGDASGLKLHLIYPYANKGDHSRIKQELSALLSAVGVVNVDIAIDNVISPAEQKSKVDSLVNVKNIIAVSSGKGGVGKSTTSVNLALALSAEGAKVGILDADIYGPSQGMMLGVKPGTHPQPLEGDKMLPIESLGISSMSIAYMVDETSPMVWRGPMASGAISQMINQTHWSALDYLLIDMPPGTGDIQLTLSQKVPITGAVVVTTPQDIALLDAKRGIEMFNKVDIPVLGVIENMSVHICSKCGHQEHIFGNGGGSAIAKQYHSELLGALPLNIDIRTQADSGKPSVVADENSPVSLIYREVARLTAARAHQLSLSADKGPSLSIVND